ncbi:MAG: C4-dicarboxylate ABC transporter substrate-binding protein [Alphaproteobacteria bacterium CG11_big_fil_rev_8_21_14_0_20_44_7]|nr:MAG: C4-dicarboxylate ABC transporter substrate-binding protein [Alphaproteobacteria bacterium CG11_big_fil_rev_8_21_14_0_20_44_7]
MRYLLVLAITITAIIFAASPFSSAESGKFITIGTGGVTGVYYPAGGAICRLVNRGRKTHGIRCSVESTGGSIDNLRMLKDGEIDVAVAQSDWQYHAYNGTDYFADKAQMKNLRSLFSLHSEPFTVVVRKDSGIKTFDDIKGKRVNIGNPGSGMRATMDFIMNYKGWKVADFAEATELQASEQAQALCSDNIDVMIYAAGHPNGAVQEVTTTCEAVIVPVSGEDIDELIEKNPYYAYTVIPGGMYNGTDVDIKTIGVKATFVALDDTPEEVVYQLVKAVFDNFDNFKTLHPVFGILDPQRLVHEGNTAPLHPGAARYFREKGML